jgi:hypothetical protein
MFLERYNGSYFITPIKEIFVFKEIMKAENNKRIIQKENEIV